MKVYNVCVAMKLLYHPIFLEHDTGMHPENRKRLESFGSLPSTDVPNGEEYLTLVHTPAYIQQVKDSGKTSSHLDPDTIVSPKSYEAAVHAVGATVMASQNGDFALVRPPGHHAFPDKARGFCIFNNIAIAVARLVGEGKRVCIFDFDGHLGDGTEKFFYSSNNVLYWSLHQYPAFPGWGTIHQIGEGEGRGFTINVPLAAGSGDDIYMRAVTALLPAAIAFKPDVVAVSAGFDGHQKDLLLNLRLSLGTYYRIGQTLRDTFRSVFATLEGGYNTEFLPKCVRNFLDGINGAPASYSETPTDSTILLLESFEIMLNDLQNNLSPYWKF